LKQVWWVKHNFFLQTCGGIVDAQVKKKKRGKFFKTKKTSMSRTPAERRFIEQERSRYALHKGLEDKAPTSRKQSKKKFEINDTVLADLVEYQKTHRSTMNCEIFNLKLMGGDRQDDYKTLLGKVNEYVNRITERLAPGSNFDLSQNARVYMGENYMTPIDAKIQQYFNAVQDRWVWIEHFEDQLLWRAWAENAKDHLKEKLAEFLCQLQSYGKIYIKPLEPILDAHKHSIFELAAEVLQPIVQQYPQWETMDADSFNNVLLNGAVIFIDLFEHKNRETATSEFLNRLDEQSINPMVDEHLAQCKGDYKKLIKLFQALTYFNEKQQAPKIQRDRIRNVQSILILCENIFAYCFLNPNKVPRAKILQQKITAQLLRFLSDLLNRGFIQFSSVNEMLTSSIDYMQTKRNWRFFAVLNS